MYTIKVVVSKKWCKIDALLHTTSRKYLVAYLFMPFPMALNDLTVIACCRTCQVQFDEHLYDILRAFN